MTIVNKNKHLGFFENNRPIKGIKKLEITK